MRRLTMFLTAAAFFVSFASVCAVAQQRPSAAVAAPAAQAANSADLDSARYRPGFTAVRYASTLPPVVGTVVSFARNTLVMKMRDGSVRTFFMSPSGPGAEHLMTVGTPLAVTLDTNGKVASVARADQVAAAMVVSVTKAGVTLRFQNGHTILLPPESLNSIHAKVAPGMPVIFTTQDGGYTSNITIAGPAH